MQTITDIRIYTGVLRREGDDLTATGAKIVGNEWLHISAHDGSTNIVRVPVGAVCECEPQPIPEPTPQCDNSGTNVLATMLRGADGKTPDMSDYYDKEDIEEKLAYKQDRIDDLDTIRKNAEKGSTALQSVPSEYVTEEKLQKKGYATTAELLAKQNVIDDLEQIRDGAKKGETALQSESYRGTVTGVKVNGSTKSPNDGIVDIGTVITEHQSLKTINGETIVGEGDIVIEGGSGSADLDGYATEEYVNNAVEAVNVKGEDGYVYSNGEKVDMRFTRSLIPVGTSIPANANLNTVAYLKVGKYYCSQNVDAKTITNCPTTSAFSMEVFNPLSPVVDNETTDPYVYRIRILTVYNTGVQYVQYATVGSTVNNWTYNPWYVVPRSPFTLNSNKKGGSAALGSGKQGVYINSEGTFTKMTYTLEKSVPANAVFTDTDTKVTAVGNHYAPVEDESAVLNAPEGNVVIGLKRDAAGHVVDIVTAAGGGGSVDTSNYYTKQEIDDKGYLTQIPEAYVKEDELSEVAKTGNYSDLKDIPSFKTVNGESIFGTGDITISGGGSASGSAQLPLNSDSLILSGQRLAIPSGKVKELTAQQTKGGTFALSLVDKKDGEDNVWVIRFAISINNSGTYQVVADEGYSIKWANGVAPTFENGKYYEMSFRLIGTIFLGVWASFE